MDSKKSPQTPMKPGEIRCWPLLERFSSFWPGGLPTELDGRGFTNQGRPGLEVGLCKTARAPSAEPVRSSWARLRRSAIWEGVGMVEGCVPPQARSMRFSTSAFAEVERSRLTVVSSTPIASAILVVDQRFARSLATTSRRSAIWEGAGMVEGCVPPQARSMRLSTSRFLEVERSSRTVHSLTPIASAILVVDQRLSLSLATTSRRCSGRQTVRRSTRGPGGLQRGPGGLCGASPTPPPAAGAASLGCGPVCSAGPAPLLPGVSAPPPVWSAGPGPGPRPLGLGPLVPPGCWRSRSGRVCRLPVPREPGPLVQPPASPLLGPPPGRRKHRVFSGQSGLVKSPPPARNIGFSEGDSAGQAPTYQPECPSAGSTAPPATGGPPEKGATSRVSPSRRRVVTHLLRAFRSFSLGAFGIRLYRVRTRRERDSDPPHPCPSQVVIGRHAAGEALVDHPDRRGDRGGRDYRETGPFNFGKCRS